MKTGDDQWASLAELASIRHGVFTRKQANELGISTRRLKSAVQKGRLRKPLSDVYIFGSHHDSFRQGCDIASAAGGVISHDSAAALHGLDGFAGSNAAMIHVCYPRDAKRPLPPRYVVHTWRRTHDADITSVGGTACTSVARTLAQLGLQHPRAIVERALDSALRLGAPAPWIESTLERLRRPGRTGLQVLEQVIADPSRSGQLTESALESVIDYALRDSDLPDPVRQHEITLASGKRRFDLAFPDAKLGIEGHSRRFHFGSGKAELDNLRDFELAAAGWEVLYITWGMAHEPSLFMRLLKQTYFQRRRLLAA